jgi:hypothetical protein
MSELRVNDVTLCWNPIDPGGPIVLAFVAEVLRRVNA